MRAKKHFGQHFLHDPYIIKRIVDAISPNQETDLIEIGPGPGALTKQLVQPARNLHVIEIDNDMVDLLQTTVANTVTDNSFHIHHISVLDADFMALGAEAPLHICGNLPYNISTPLLFHLCNYQHVIKRMVFMMQKEVIDRIVAGPGSKTYGRLTVSLGYRFASEKLFNVKPGAFNPPPKVDSSMVLLTPRKQGELPELYNVDDFDSLVKQAFSQRRKTLRKVLKGRVSPEQFDIAEIDSGDRAETLSVQDFIRLSNASEEK